MELWGVDFTCAPSARKPITVARGRWRDDAVVELLRIDELRTLEAFEALLIEPGLSGGSERSERGGPWFGAFDLPFGLPRVFVDELGLGANADAVITELHRRCTSRMAFRALIDGWTNGRPAGQRLVHRGTDRTRFGVSSTSPLQSRYVPVAFMYFEAMHRVVKADVTIPRLRRGRRGATAVEGYPGLLAHELIGTRSYKNGDDEPRRAARREIVERLLRGDHRLGVAVVLDAKQRRTLVDDEAGDRLDAVLCLVQAAWCARRRGAGAPRNVDPVEGWIATA
jgi:Protein of unknown function (DUF429)